MWWRNAPALRFLAFFLVAWIGIRAVSPMMETSLVGVMGPAPKAASAVASEAAARAVDNPPAHGDPADGGNAIGKPVAVRAALGYSPPIQPERVDFAAMDSPKSRIVAERLESTAQDNALNGTAPFPLFIAPSVDASEPLRSAGAAGFSRRLAGWSLSAWALVREQGDGRQALPVVGELAGSQAGARVAYGFGANGRLRAYGRASAALEHQRQSEAAVGLTYAPIAALPLDVAVERRIKLGSDGRTAMAAMLVSGVSGQALPAQFRLDAYGQAGVVGMRSRDIFADGAVVIDRAVSLSAERTSLRVGAVVAGAAQPHLSRLDIGPRVTLPLPQVGRGARIAVDWRHRIMGRARPDSGLALTLGADF